MKLIAAVDKNGGIGLNGHLLFSCSSDLHNFQRLTLGKTVIMGRKTWESLPVRPLAGRNNVIISTTVEHRKNQIMILDSIEKCVELYGNDKDVFVIGGGQIYRAFLPYVETAYITKFFHEREADTFLIDFEKDPEWTLSETSPLLNEKGLCYQFMRYDRVLHA